MKRMIFGGLLLAGAGILTYWNSPTVQAADGPAYTADGKLKLPVGYRKWVFIGTP